MVGQAGVLPSGWGTADDSPKVTWSTRCQESNEPEPGSSLGNRLDVTATAFPLLCSTWPRSVLSLEGLTLGGCVLS